MKKTRKLYGIYFLFVALLSLTPVVSSLLLWGKESYVSAIVSQSSLGLGAGKRGVVTVINPETGDREVVSERDYLCGVVASQMPADYDDEAISAGSGILHPDKIPQNLRDTGGDAELYHKKGAEKQLGRGLQCELLPALPTGRFRLRRIYRV